MANALAPKEKARLKELEAIVIRGMNTFLEVGTALGEIRDERLYLENHKTFKEYCQDRFNISDRHARRLINATEVVDNLLPPQSSKRSQGTAKSTNGIADRVIPDGERQTRPLVGLEPEDQREAWQAAVESANGEQPTAEQVQVAVGKIVDSEPTVESFVDDNGKAVPERLKAVFSAIPMFNSAVVACERAATAMKRAEETKAYDLADEFIRSKKGDRMLYSTVFRTVGLNLKWLRPAVLCPEGCAANQRSLDAEPCPKCQDRGYLFAEDVEG